MEEKINKLFEKLGIFLLELSPSKKSNQQFNLSSPLYIRRIQMRKNQKKLINKLFIVTDLFCLGIK